VSGNLRQNDIAGENLNEGPLFKAMNSCPSSWKTTVITVPFNLPDAPAPASP
jgi:hypothetical protein